MARKAHPHVPPFRKHKGTGQAYALLDGRRHYFGRHNTPEARQRYDRLIAEWLAEGRRPRVEPNGVTVVELAAASWRHAQQHYRKPSGQPTSTQHNYQAALRPLKRLYGEIPVKGFGPIQLKACRQTMIDAGWCRGVVNKTVNLLRGVFRWGVAEGLIPVEVHTALCAVRPLERGRTPAKDRDPVRPVPGEFVDAIREHVSRQVWAIVELQRLTGMRSGEVVIMRGRDLDTSGAIWLYRPESHKTQHHDHDRVVQIGPRSQAVIKPFLKPDLEAFLFSPADAEAERRADLHARRKTPMSCGNRPGSNRRRHPMHTPSDRYTASSYRQAIQRGCDIADRRAKDTRGIEPDAERIIPRWHPHQLRHNYGTMIRREYGIEAARILLGHKSVGMAELYSEIDRGKAREITAKIG